MKEELEAFKNRKKDYIVRATADNAQIRAFAARTTATCEAARAAHQTSPVMTAALGRLATAAVMMGAMQKGEGEQVTLKIEGAGPGKGLFVTADAEGNVKGYPKEPIVMLPPNSKGHLNVGGALAPGFLTVIKDLGLKDPYVGQTMLITGEIGDDLTEYFMSSEQIPSSVGLGVLVDKDLSVKEAGGFIIQLMPFAEDSVISKLEENLSKVTSVTEMLEEGKNPEDILKIILDGFDIEFNDTMPCRFHCNCSKQRFFNGLATLDKKDLKEMVDANEPIETRCQFCGKKYHFTPEKIKELL